MVAARTQLEATALAWIPHRVHGDVTASLLRSYGGHTALVLRFHGVLLILWRSHREYTELPRRSLRSYSVCRALKQRCQCVVRKPNKNGINTASSLSPHFCARPHHGCCISPASRATPCLYAGPLLAEVMVVDYMAQDSLGSSSLSHWCPSSFQPSRCAVMKW